MSAVKKPNRVIVFLSSFIGTALEQYDFLLYGIRCRTGIQQTVLPYPRSADRRAGGVATYATGYVDVRSAASCAGIWATATAANRYCLRR